MPFSPVDFLGLDVVRAGVPRWHAALRAGFRAAPKCDFTCVDGRRCGHVSMVAGRGLEPPVFRCATHMPAKHWFFIDLADRRRSSRLARSVNPELQRHGLSRLRRIELRQVLHLWRFDPELEATVIELSAADQGRVDAWLANHGFDLGHLPETGRPMTPCRRNYVYLKVALHLSGRLLEPYALRAVRSAIRRDVKWFAAKDALEAELPAWDSGYSPDDIPEADRNPAPGRDRDPGAGQVGGGDLEFDFDVWFDPADLDRDSGG